VLYVDGMEGHLPWGLAMVRLRQLIDTYRYISSVIYIGAVIISCIFGLRTMGYEPRSMLGMHEPVPAYTAPTHPVSARIPRMAAATPAVAAPSTVLTASAPVTPTILWPLHGKVTTEFGAPDLPYQAHHTGIDISSGRPSGVSGVVAYRAGQVIRPPRPMYGYGNLVTIDHGGGLISYYGHLASIRVVLGQQVSAGQAIGQEGSTGNSTGPHLHFEIQQNGIPVNPRNYLTGNP
jgi:murein DD-endopeptidase MepM/ murein hydrolase activator NlpD